MSENMKDFYYYDGSLTTPKCNQAVKWIVFKDEISISSDQVSLYCLYDLLFYIFTSACYIHSSLVYFNLRI